GLWKGHRECHVCNAGDWLLIWIVDNGVAYLERTGTHNELFR
ncbi:type II toxin-antitoxin system YafQ family toxin, partial [Adlercreutzia sp. ZJ154]